MKCGVGCCGQQGSNRVHSSFDDAMGSLNWWNAIGAAILCPPSCQAKGGVVRVNTAATSVPNRRMQCVLSEDCPLILIVKVSPMARCLYFSGAVSASLKDICDQKVVGDSCSGRVGLLRARFRQPVHGLQSTQNVDMRNALPLRILAWLYASSSKNRCNPVL